jgi:hypothetical protein
LMRGTFGRREGVGRLGVEGTSRMVYPGGGSESEYRLNVGYRARILLARENMAEQPTEM